MKNITQISTAFASLSILVSFANADLVVNGDFEDPSLAGINSDYTHTPSGNAIEGSWWVNPWNPGGPWNASQHTPGGVAAMSVNGDDSSQSGISRVWYQTVTLVEGEQYDFSTWALGTVSGFSGYSLKFAFNGEQVGDVFSPTLARTWEQFSTPFTAPSSSVEISIVNVSGITFPNDFMLDDISLTRVPSPSTAALLGLSGLLVSRRHRS